MLTITTLYAMSRTKDQKQIFDDLRLNAMRYTNVQVDRVRTNSVFAGQQSREVLYVDDLFSGHVEERGRPVSHWVLRWEYTQCGSDMYMVYVNDHDGSLECPIKVTVKSNRAAKIAYLRTIPDEDTLAKALNLMVSLGFKTARLPAKAKLSHEYKSIAANTYDIYRDGSKNYMRLISHDE